MEKSSSAPTDIKINSKLIQTFQIDKMQTAATVNTFSRLVRICNLFLFRFHCNNQIQFVQIFLFLFFCFFFSSFL